MTPFYLTRRLSAGLLGLLLVGSLPACKKDDVAPAPTPEVTLYERLGKSEGIAQIVDKFMANVGAECSMPNSVLLRSHQEFLDDVGHGNTSRKLLLRNNLIDQFGSVDVSGGPLVYKGKSMLSAHQGMQITDAEFDEVAHQLTLAMNDSHVAAADQQQLLNVLAAMRGAVVGH